MLVNGTGALSKPKDPEIPGLDSYKGKKLHTGHWDLSYDYRGKTICQIGNGASGIQAFAELQPAAKKMWVSRELAQATGSHHLTLVFTHSTLFQRTPSWITAYRLKGSYTEEEKLKFAQDEAGWRKMRAEMWDDWEKGWDMFVPGSLNQTKMMSSATKKMEKDIKDPELRKKLMPDYPGE